MQTNIVQTLNPLNERKTLESKHELRMKQTEHLKTAKETWDYAEKVSQEVSMLFPKPIKLEFEAVIYWRLTNKVKSLKSSY